MSKSTHTSSESYDTTSYTTTGTAAASGGASTAAATTASESYSETIESTSSKSFEKEFMEAFTTSNQSKLIELVLRATEEQINRPVAGTIMMINSLKGEALDLLLQRPDLKVNFSASELLDYGIDLPILYHISNPSVLEKLIEKGANFTSAIDGEELLPIDYALKQRSIKSLELLLEHGAKVTKKMEEIINKSWFAKSGNTNEIAIKDLINRHIASQGYEEAAVGAAAASGGAAATETTASESYSEGDNSSAIIGDSSKFAGCADSE